MKITLHHRNQGNKIQVMQGAKLPYTTPTQMRNLSPMDFEIVFVAIAIIGFGLLTYEFVGRVDKSYDFYPK